MQDKDPQHYDDVKEIPFELDDIHPLISYGAFGVVDKVKVRAGCFEDRSLEDRSLVRKLFIKVQKEDVETVQGEAKILKKAQHYHVVELIMTYIYESPHGISFAMITDSADVNLERYLHNDSSEKPPRLEHIPQWFGCLLSAISFIHGIDIRHRDIKPASILIKKKKVMLGGFDIATVGETVSTTVTSRPSATTPTYCAPEVEEGGTSGKSADIFSLGAVFLEMLIAHSYPKEFQRLKALTTGENRSYANNISEVQGLMENPEKGPQHVDWHSEILGFCRRMLDPDRGKRPTAEEMYSKWPKLASLEKSVTPCGCVGGG